MSMEHIGRLFELPPTRKKADVYVPNETLDRAKKRRGPRNERDELMEYFLKRLRPAWPKLTMRLLCVKTAHLKDLQDLFYIKSVCEDAERRGGVYSKVFWGSLRVREDDKIRK